MTVKRPPIKLDNGQVVTIKDIPRGLTEKEIDKIYAVIKALAIKVNNNE